MGIVADEEACLPNVCAGQDRVIVWISPHSGNYRFRRHFDPLGKTVHQGEKLRNLVLWNPLLQKLLRNLPGEMVTHQEGELVVQPPPNDFLGWACGVLAQEGRPNTFVSRTTRGRSVTLPVPLHGGPLGYSGLADGCSQFREAACDISPGYSLELTRTPACFGSNLRDAGGRATGGTTLPFEVLHKLGNQGQILFWKLSQSRGDAFDPWA